MKTLHVNTERTWRGGEQQTLLLARGLAARGHGVDVACQPGSPMAERARQAGLSVREVKMRGEFDLVAVRRLAALLRAGGHDVVHMHTSHAHTLGVLASLVARRARRIVSRRVDFSIHRTPLRLNGFKYRHGVHRYVAISRAVKDALVKDGVDGARIDVVSSGVDVDDLARRREAARSSGATRALRERLGLGDRSPVIGHVGHLTWHKGQKHLVAAMPRVLEAHPRAVAVIVGEGGERAALEADVARLGLGGAVRLAGFVEDPVPAYGLFDVFVMPSVMEGLCTSILDAMTLEAVVVAAGAGGIPEIVRDGDNGLLVPPGDPAALAEAILRALADAPLRERLRAAGVETVRRRFSADAMVDGTLAVYESVLAAVVAAPAVARR